MWYVGQLRVCLAHGIFAWRLNRPIKRRLDTGLQNREISRVLTYPVNSRSGQDKSGEESDEGELHFE